MKHKNKPLLLRYLLCLVLYLLILWIAMLPSGKDESDSDLDHVAATGMEQPVDVDTMGCD